MLNYGNRSNAPASAAFAITPSDSTDLATITRGLLLGAAGTVKVDMLEGSTVTVTLVAGVIHPLRVKRVHATGTTATGIIGFY